MYQIVYGENMIDLQIKVNEEMRNGYMPLGGPFALHSVSYAQAMIKTIETRSNNIDIHNYERHR